jgi:hypothetical protein
MSNNINGGGRSRNAMSSVDFYRRVPKDLTEVRSLISWFTSYLGPTTTMLVPPSRLYVVSGTNSTWDVGTSLVLCGLCCVHLSRISHFGHFPLLISSMRYYYYDLIGNYFRSGHVHGSDWHHGGLVSE